MDSKGIVLSNSQNKTNGKHIHNYSTFDKSLSYIKANTLRFAEITPSFEMEGVEKDEVQVNSLDKIDSLSLNAPFKSQIRKIKQSFKVPYMAILPHNWDRIYVQPSNGGDVPDDANCVIQDFPAKYKDFFLACLASCRSNVPASTDTHAYICGWLTALVRTLVFGEYIYSAGCLAHVCGYKRYGDFFQYVEGFEGTDYDAFMDRIVYDLFEHIKHFKIVEPYSDDMQYPSGWNRPFNCSGLAADPEHSNRYISLRAVLDIFRENPNTYFDPTAGSLTFDDSIGESGFGAHLQAMFNRENSLIDPPTIDVPASHSLPDDVADLTDRHPGNFNLSRLLAYQLCCFHFMTNSSLDSVYTAELYRDYAFALERGAASTAYPNIAYFSQNGISLPYDSLSGHLLVRCTIRNTADNAVTSSASYVELCSNSSVITANRFALLAAIFAYRRSLRYGDYFVGSRPRPLAPFNTDVAVQTGASGDYVSVIDVTRNIQAQRFANAVMRSRSKIEEYVESMFGKKPDVDYHNPLFLSEEVESIYGEEVQNTAETQVTSAQSRTANFANGLGRYTFTFHNDDMHPCVYLQLISFDVRRSYTRSTDRQFLINDRYDMFNPDFQYIGDQAVYGIELGYHAVGSNIRDVFAYQTRDAEYKQRFDVACGAFANGRLPGWLLTDDENQKFSANYLDSDFIRNYSAELDKFFLSLSGFSLGHYFHFNLITHNNVNAKRAMAVDPQILA